jgi:hypothetical protein
MPSSKLSSVAELPFVARYQDASELGVDYQDEDNTVKKAQDVRLNPYKHLRVEDKILKLHAINRVRSSEAAEQWASERGFSVRDGEVEIVIESTTSTPVPVEQIESLGGTVEKTTQGDRVVWMPVDSLDVLASSLGEEYRARMPHRPQPNPIDSEAPERTRGDYYHEVDGLKGDDVSVGVIDLSFDDVPSADLPSSTTTLDCTGSSCTSTSLGSSSSDHGTAAAEMAADGVPEATFRLYKVGNTSDLRDAVSDGLSNGVNVFTHSVSWFNTGWSDDSGGATTAANDASSSGALFFTSAGNYADDQHWQGAFSDGDGDNLHGWSGGDECSAFTLAAGDDVTMWLQWDRSGSDTDDYDLFVYDSACKSIMSSSTSGGESYEAVSVTNSSGGSQSYRIVVRQNSGDGDFETFLADDENLEHDISASSTTSPSNATGDNVISVAAVDQENFEDSSPSAEDYSSRGPTNDGNQAPDLTGPTNTSTSGGVISGGTFGGTSAATPNAAGAAGQLWDLRAESNDASASNVREPLLNTALKERDWGSGGVDFTFGYGGVILPRPLDIYFVVDLSGSFDDDLVTFQNEAKNTMSNIRNNVNVNSRFGLGSFEDYPINPFGSSSAGDEAYRQEIDMTFDDDAVASKIDGLTIRFGNDTPQSQLPALYQAATGAGQDLSGAGYPGASIPPGQEASLREGDADTNPRKIFILWTDASFHRPGDPGDIPYPGQSLSDVLSALRALDPPRVLGISSGGGGRADTEEITEASGAVAPEGGVDCDGNGTVEDDEPAEGEPIVCDIGSGGSGVATAVEAAVEAAEEAPPLVSGATVYPRSGGGSDPVEGATVTADPGSDSPISATTASDGGFGMTVTDKKTYDVSVTEIPGSPSGIDVSDAFLIARAFLGEASLTDFQSEVADVNDDGTADVSDAFAIVRNFLGELSSFAAGPFISERREASVSGSDVTLGDLRVAATGDPTLDGGVGGSGDAAALAEERSEEGGLEVRRSRTGSGRAEAKSGSGIAVPIRAGSGVELGAFQFSVGYASEEVRFEGVESQGAEVQARAEGGTVQVGWFDREGGKSPLSVEEGEPIVTLRFKEVSGGTEEGRALRFEAGKLMGPGGEVLSGAEVEVPTVDGPGQFALQAPAPNPFRERAVLRMDLPEAGEVTVEVYNTLGQKVAEIQRQVSAGYDRAVEIDGSRFGSGAYFYRVQVEQGAETVRRSGRMTVVK